MSSIYRSGFEKPKDDQTIINELKALDAPFAESSSNNFMDRDTKLAKELCEVDHGLSDWEVNFVESVARRVLDKKIPFTVAQREKANQIMAKIDRIDTE